MCPRRNSCVQGEDSMCPRRNSCVQGEDCSVRGEIHVSKERVESVGVESLVMKEKKEVVDSK